MREGVAKATHTPKSRRERPAKPPLSKEWMVDAALHILQTEGLSQVTMRRVAQALDTGAASLYVYLANTAELHAELLDRLLAELPEPQTADWQAALLEYLEGYGAVLAAHPGLARSALTLRPAGPHFLRVHEVAAGLLVRGGVPTPSALWGADLLILLVTASAAEHTTPTESAVPTTPIFTEAHPLLNQHASAVLGGTPQQRQRWQLQTVIAGLRHVPVPTLEEKQP